MRPSSLGEYMTLFVKTITNSLYSMIVTNPTSYIVTVAEHAAAKILGLN